MQTFYPDTKNITLTPVHFSANEENKITVSVLRLDKIHPVISGNKWFKLRVYAEEVMLKKSNHIVTFGGAWSNHIAATAAFCELNRLSSTGIIRGERPSTLSDTLQDAERYGMNLVFISREDYKQKKLPASIQTLIQKNNAVLIREGGYGEKGVAGAATIADFFSPGDFTHICAAVGTGTMIAGLATAAGQLSCITGISVLKNNLSIIDDIQNISSRETARCINILHDYHFGGYAKYTPELLAFMNNLFQTTGIPTDFVYTAKLFYGANDLVKKGYFPAGSRVLIIHSGGLQGNRSLQKGTLIY